MSGITIKSAEVKDGRIDVKMWAVGDKPYSTRGVDMAEIWVSAVGDRLVVHRGNPNSSRVTIVPDLLDAVHRAVVLTVILFLIDASQSASLIAVFFGSAIGMFLAKRTLRAITRVRARSAKRASKVA